MVEISEERAGQYLDAIFWYYGFVDNEYIFSIPLIRVNYDNFAFEFQRVQCPSSPPLFFGLSRENATHLEVSLHHFEQASYVVYPEALHVIRPIFFHG